MFEGNLIKYENKKPNSGSDLLIPYDEWVTPDDLYGHEKVLTHPIIEKSFERILELYTPNSRTAFLSLCTSSRPYSKSYKWRTFIKEFGDEADLIVCSNGGIIPKDYWECYPYMTYEGRFTKGDRQVYIDIGYDRVYRFFDKFQNNFDTIVFNFNPRHVFREVAEKFSKSNLGEKFNIKILPTLETYEKARARGFNHGKMFPDLDDYVMDELKEAVGIVPQKSNPVPSRKVLW